MRRESYLASVIVLLLACVLAAGCASTSQMARPTPAGAWEYVILDTPQGDAHGTLMVASERNVYSGELYIDILDQTVPIEEGAFTDSTFTFKATLDAGGQPIGTATRMTLSGNMMKGTIQTEGIGELAITATRKVMDDSRGYSQNPRAEDWRMDLRDLVSELSRRHVDLYHSVSKDSFEQAVAELDRRTPSLSRAQILVEVAQLVALIGDGHTSFYPGDQRGMEFHYYPIRLWSFSDGMYMIAASEDYADVLGKRLIQIDNTPIEEAFSAVSTTVGADNDMEYRYTVPFELRRPEMLHTLGIAEAADQAAFIFEGGLRATFHALTRKESSDVKWRSASTLFGEQDLPTLRLDYLFATPLTLEHVVQREYYWFTYLEEHKALYFQYNQCWDQKGKPTFEDVTKELFQYMEDHPVERLIVDLRQNAGGEPLTAQPLIDGLAQRTNFTQEGRLFVLVGRRTFSAALTNAAQLRSRAGARIVGEPSRGKPNNPSEGRDIKLKRTKTYVTVSTQFVERDPALGNARYLPVDIEATYTFKSYRENQDPVLEAALRAEIVESN